MIQRLKEISKEEQYFIAIMCVALLLRLYALAHIAVIQSDGVIYLYQAKALSTLKWNAATTCGYSFVSLYPLLIALFHLIIPNWEGAASAVSIIFGTATIIPMYLILRRLLAPSIALISVFLFAVNPIFVKESAEIMKDPVFWFFAILGLYLFIRAIDSGSPRDYIASNIVLSISVLARAEGVFLIFGSLLFLVFRWKRGMRNLFYFGAPLLVMLLLTVAGMFLQKNGQSLWSIYVLPRMKSLHYVTSLSPFSGPLHDTLKMLHEQGVVPHADFIVFVRDLIWYIAFGVLFMRIWEIYYVLFLVPVVLGFNGLWGKIKGDPRVRYLMALSVVSFVFLYLYTIIIWVMPTRYLAVFYLPSFILVGFGIERIIMYFTEKGYMRKSVVALMCVLAFLVTLPDIAKSTRKERLPFKQIGEFIAEKSGNADVNIATSEVWINYYAKKLNESLICPVPNIDYRALTQKPYDQFVAFMRERNVHYVLVEEKKWSDASYDILSSISHNDFNELGTWQVGKQKMVLFDVRY